MVVQHLKSETSPPRRPGGGGVGHLIAEVLDSPQESDFPVLCIADLLLEYLENIIHGQL